MAVCNTCKGKKTVIVPAEKSPLGVAFEDDCPDCRKMGVVGVPCTCPHCNGSKKVIVPAEKSPLGVAFEDDCPDCSD